jgi:hypothetical protein
MSNAQQKEFNEILDFVKSEELAAAEKRSNDLKLGISNPKKRGIFGQMIDAGQIVNPRAKLLKNSQQLHQQYQ